MRGADSGQDISVRYPVARARRAGGLVRHPCVRCGTPKALAHHEDYSKPLEVMWLCRKCHYARHRELGTFPQRPKRQTFVLGLPPDLMEAVDRLAAREERSRAKMVEIMLRRAVQEAEHAA